MRETEENVSIVAIATGCGKTLVLQVAIKSMLGYENHAFWYMQMGKCLWSRQELERKVNKFICHRRCNCVLNASASFRWRIYGKSTKWTRTTSRRMYQRWYDAELERIEPTCIMHSTQTHMVHRSMFAVRLKTNSICLWRASDEKWLTIEPCATKSNGESERRMSGGGEFH